MPKRRGEDRQNERAAVAAAAAAEGAMRAVECVSSLLISFPSSPSPPSLSQPGATRRVRTSGVESSSSSSSCCLSFVCCCRCRCRCLLCKTRCCCCCCCLQRIQSWNRRERRIEEEESSLSVFPDNELCVSCRIVSCAPWDSSGHLKEEGRKGGRKEGRREVYCIVL